MTTRIFKDSAKGVRTWSNNPPMTTGQVARCCSVAPRTVSKWFDSGKLKGYRIPGSQDRRVLAKTLIAFLKASGMPVPAELMSAVGWPALFLVGADGDLGIVPDPDKGPGEVTVLPGMFELGAAVSAAGGATGLVVLGPDVTDSEFDYVLFTALDVTRFAVARLYGPDQKPEGYPADDVAAARRFVLERYTEML